MRQPPYMQPGRRTLNELPAQRGLRTVGVRQSNTRSHSPSRGGSGPADARTDRRRRPDRPRTPAGSPNATYDYFILSQQWSPGICAAEPQCVSTSKKNYWTIHGLWPSGDNTSPSFCVDEQFNGRVLDPIKRDLNKYWPSLTSAEARYFTFWRHQWQKHGTCAGDVPALNGLFNFFNSTLAVYKKYNIFEFLSNSLIRPSVVRTYSASEIRNALSDDIREKVNIVCSQRVPNRDAPVLTEIRFCLDKNLETVNCQGRNGGCGRRNYYLPARP
ncbi:ribonuclease Oy [Dermacentor silvarum]|uniref:ribonuclease Oy n=1 Tax=Dermacentor silvarum TaxID=543639 RepID=UPI00189BBCE3|nr:ribonuclease Oy [Dermacentor silvarum]